MGDDSALRFSFPKVYGRKTTAAFDGGRLTSDDGVLLLVQAERRMGLATALAILDTAAYWLIWELRQKIPATIALRAAEFATLRARLIKFAARVVETASRVRIAFASACPDAAIFKTAAINLRMASP